MKNPSHELVLSTDANPPANSDVLWWNPATGIRKLGDQTFTAEEWKQRQAEALYLSVGGDPDRLATKEKIHEMKEAICLCQINNDQVNEVWEVVDSWFKTFAP
jgi:hypothetical protein